MTSSAQDQTIAFNGLRFHYRDWGNESAPALVLLHGLSGHSRTWDSFARELREHYHVLALDQRGHGQSEWTSDYSRPRMVEDLEAFARALGLRRFALVGLSMGGRVAYVYAAQRPETVERLVIVDIGPETAAAGAQRIRTGLQSKDVFDTPEEAFRQSRAANPRPPEAELRHRVFHNLMQREETWRYDKAFRSPDRPLQSPEDPSMAWGLLAKITCPTLLVRGAESDVLSREAAERMTREMPDCRLVEVLNSGHSVPTDNPAGFLEAVRPFLTAASAGRGSG
ncbi:MAG: alpha/beta hydrolase [Chloroflexi bacterium]|nr:alpha/beta hydrolase [Chloroflexota bacterium]